MDPRGICWGRGSDPGIWHLEGQLVAWCQQDAELIPKKPLVQILRWVAGSRVGSLEDEHEDLEASAPQKLSESSALHQGGGAGGGRVTEGGSGWEGSVEGGRGWAGDRGWVRVGGEC